MRAYIGWILDLSDGKTVFRHIKKLIVARDGASAQAQLIALASTKLAYDPAIHHAVVLEIDRLPELL